VLGASCRGCYDDVIVCRQVGAGRRFSQVGDGPQGAAIGRCDIQLGGTGQVGLQEDL
jgi:hypothetical protein